MDRQSVLHVIWSAKLGGITRLVLDLCEYQRRHQFTSADILVCKNEGGIKHAFTQAGIGYHELGLNSGMDINPAKLARCVRLMKRYDIIHLHIFHPIISLAALVSSKKIIFTEHGNFGLGRNTGFSGMVIQHLKTSFLNRPDVTITCNSQFTAHTLSKLNSVNENKLRIVYNGIPERTETPRTEHTWKKDNEFLIVSIGRLAGVKRFDRVIEAFRKAGIENSRLLIMGEGPLLADLKQIVFNQPQGPSVEFIGPGDSLALLQEADLCIIGSQGEAFGLVAVEAYQAGKRVLVFKDGGGVTEITGGLDPEAICNGPEALANQIRITFQNTRYLNPEWAEKAKHHAATFGIQKMAAAFNRLYQS